MALRLSKHKGKVFALSKRLEFLETLKNEDSTIEIISVNLSNWNTTRKAIEEILPIDMLVNNAGVACLGPFLKISEEQFDLTMNVNVKAIFNISQIISGDMIERKIHGSIVNISSQASFAALKDHSIYCASKGAVDMLTK